jgi:dTDP-4-amino-4,6-dideoxygalactose transaminase
LFIQAEAGELAPFEPEWAQAVYHLYVVRVRDRVGLTRRLAEEGISAGIHYPVPLHLQTAYEWLGYKVGAFPVTEHAASDIISLPMFPGLTDEDRERVAKGVHAFVSRGSAVMVAADL